MDLRNLTIPEGLMAISNYTPMTSPGQVETANNISEVVRRLAPYPRSATIVASICCIVFIVLGVLGNLVTMIALWRCVKLRNATTAFVISLCTADLLFCAINLPLTASRYIHEDWLLGETLCELFPFFFYGNVAASLMSMTAITVNRFVLINLYHLYDKIYQRRNVLLMIFLYWLFSFGIMILPLARIWGQLGYQPNTFSCTILPLNGRSPKKFLFALGFLLPCVVIIVSYSCIFFKVHRSRRNIPPDAAALPDCSPSTLFTQPTPASGLLKADEMRLTRLMLIIFCSFLVCFLPLMIVNVFDNDMRLPTLHILASILAWMSSCINPLIYAVMNRQYRKAYVRLLCPSRARRGSRSGSSECSKTVVSDVLHFNAITNKIEHKKRDQNGS